MPKVYVWCMMLIKSAKHLVTKRRNSTGLLHVVVVYVKITSTI